MKKSVKKWKISTKEKNRNERAESEGEGEGEKGTVEGSEERQK